MKLLKIAIVVCLGLVVIWLPGCLTKTPVITTATVPQVTQVPQVVTMPVVVPTTFVGAGGVTTVQNVTNFVTVTNEVPFTNWVTVQQTNFVFAADSNKIAGVAGTLGTINSASAPLNPYAPIVSTVIPWGAALVGAISTAFAGYLNNKKAGVISAIVQGVEGAAPAGGNDLTPVSVSVVKASVAKKAAIMGISPAVDAAVQKVT